MPDQLPDIRTPLPDLAHEALRAGLVGTLDGLAAEVQRINATLLLLEATADFAQSTLATVRSAREQMTGLAGRVAALEQGGAQMQAALADLTARVAALEPPPPVEESPAEEPAPDEPSAVEEPAAEEPVATDP
ncbi:hypothetical protein [Geodermatophilus chilensis]|uniref:hypothetical protein n=1 Tax=Geodermatophilus chilensis TaxID=2035835 RepID=UPI000C25D477|nr:hypothetical protein [Geodermatophilus chilensis]